MLGFANFQLLHYQWVWVQEISGFGPLPLAFWMGNEGEQGGDQVLSPGVSTLPSPPPCRNGWGFRFELTSDPIIPA